jgi:hypothetical protein
MVSMPVQINCPLSGLQLTIEREAHNIEFLTRAAAEPNSLKRLALVAVYGCVRAILFKDRVRKPFNAMLGETYELVTPTYRLIAEQVSHHPPISACFIQGDGFIYEKSFVPKIKFTGRSISAADEGACLTTLFAGETGKELYNIGSAKTAVGNLIIGETYIEPLGTCEVVNHTTGEKAHCEFPGRGYFSSAKEVVNITVKDANGQARLEITGRYHDVLEMKDLENGETTEIWRCPDYLPKNA